MIKRRDFLKATGAGVSLLSLSSLGCGVPPEELFGGGVDVPLKVGEARLAYDGAGLSYELDSARHKVIMRRLDGSVGWEIGGLGSEHGRFNYPVALTPHSDGLISVADRGNRRVELFDNEGRHLRQLGANDGELEGPRDVAVGPSGELYVCDTMGHRVQVFAAEGAFSRSIGAFGTGATELNGPVALAFDPDHALHVLDRGNARVQVYATDGRHLRSYGAYGSRPGQFLMPSALVIGDDGSVYVGDVAARQISVFAPDGRFLATMQPRCADGRPGQLSWMSWIPRMHGAADGRLYVAVRPIDVEA